MQAGQPAFACETIIPLIWNAINVRCDLKHLSTFVAVAEELNFHRAAERLTMARPAAGYIVLELEDRPGGRLESTTRKVSLTESGRFSLEDAQQIPGRMDVAESTVRRLRRIPHGAAPASAAPCAVSSSPAGKWARNSVF
jgi:DNA-binding transcriptional LysR family regulator